MSEDQHSELIGILAAVGFLSNGDNISAAFGCLLISCIMYSNLKRNKQQQRNETNG